MASFDADNLTDSELRSKLAEYGHPVGPVTETTRKILIKKLKILMKQKNAVRNAGRSLTRFSSGDESESDTDQNGGNRNLRRVSMPPPTSYRSSKRKSSSRNYTPEISPVPSISKVSCSTPITPSRSNSDFRVSKFSTPTSSIKQPQYTAIIRPTVSSPHLYDFESGSDSDVPDFKHHPSPTRRRSGLPYGSLSSYRSRLNNANSMNFKTPGDLLSLRLRNDSKKESRPFLSNFVGRFSCKSGLNDSLNPLDIKESDIEDDGFTDKWRKVNISSRSFNFRDWSRPFKSVFQYFKSKDSTVSSRYKSWNNNQLLSMVLLGLFLLFFIWLAWAYFRVSHRAGIGGKSSHNYPVCNDQLILQKVPCIPGVDLKYAVRIYKDVHMELQARGLRSLCGPPLEDGSMQKPYMTEKEVINFLLKSRPIEEFGRVSQGVKHFKLLILANKHWGISLINHSNDFEPLVNDNIPEDRLALQSDILSNLDNDTNLSFISQNLVIPWTCYLARLFYRVLLTLFLTVLVIGSAYLAYVIWKYYKKTKQEENDQVMALVEKILEHVSEVAERANSGIDSNGSLTSLPQDFVAVRHVHDTLIHPTERQKMAGIWQKAVKFIEENESRIRTEVQQVWGEDATVWRWLGPTLTKTQTSSPVNSDSGIESNHLYPDLSSLKAEAKKGSDRVWQGEAFETSEGSMNSLPSSPTQCLKIRHMFKHDKDYGPDWVLKVKDAIVEKCEGARIVHLSVDQESKEGCVYVKCASPQDAGIAYRQLHGSWFDGALVTVKYLRLERYHERFPDSAYARTPLRPSNNLRLSLQGTSS